MLFFEDQAEANRAADAAMRRLVVEGLLPTPNHYTIWYAYYTGRYPDLVRAIDALSSRRVKIDSRRCDELYRRYFSTEVERDAIRDAGDRVDEAIEAALAALQLASTDVADYGNMLAAARGNFDLVATLEHLKNLIRSLANATGRIADRNRLLQSQLGQTSSMIDEMRRNLDNVRQEALTDALTGIGNRKRFDLELQAAIRAADDRGVPLALILIDIDHFKVFNDKHGHVCGDQVLKLVARSLQDCVDVRDCPVRYGGEEFAIIMPGGEPTAAFEIAERVRKLVASRRIVKRTTGESMGTITLSAGVALYRPGEGMLDFIHRADAAMYRAKGLGRNRVEGSPTDAAG